MRFPFQKRSQSSRSRHLRAGRLRLRLELLEDRAMLATIGVDTFADVVADDGQTSLREAIAQAAAMSGDDTIELPAGTYPLALGQLVINDSSGSVTIQSSGGTATIDAQDASRVLDLFGGRVVLEGLSITGGFESGFFGVPGQGGGIRNFGDLTLTSSTVAGNTVSFGLGGGGGGIWNAGTLTLEDSSVAGNSVLFGDAGGIFNGPFGVVTIADSDLSGNVAGGGAGGAVMNFHELTISDSQIEFNAAGQGGGIWNASTLTVQDSTLNGNSAQFGPGGGIMNQGAVTIADSEFSGNSAPFGNGGGLANVGTADIADSTFESNSASHGGGISNEAGGNITVADSRFAGNSASGGDGSGGGLNNYGAATVEASTFENNVAAFAGGGLANDGAFGTAPTISITGSTFRGNSAFAGAGIYNFSASATVAASTIEANSTPFGFAAGVYNVSFGGPTAALSLLESTVADNAAGSVGGGIVNFGAASLDISASTISGNSAGAVGGGGIFNQSFGGLIAAVTIVNSTIAGNTAAGSGGGIYNDDDFGGTATLDITSATISDNSATDSGGGTFNTATATLRNTIVAGNFAPTAPDVFGAFSSGGFNLIGIGDGSTGFGATGDQVGTAASPIDPLLGPLADNGGPTETMALLPGSPALDAGDPALAGTTDQRGVLRPQGPGVDIGAFELEYETVDVVVKPGSDGGPINLNSNGLTPIAILGSGDFDAADVDVSSLASIKIEDPTLGIQVSPVQVKLEDVNGDGLLDLLLCFSTQDLAASGALDAASTSLLLTGFTADGGGVMGVAAVRTVGGKKRS